MNPEGWAQIVFMVTLTYAAWAWALKGIHDDLEEDDADDLAQDDSY